MQVLDKIPEVIDHPFIFDQWHFSLYPVPKTVLDWVNNNLLTGNTVVLFSGEHRFNFDATYIEPNFLSSVNKPRRNSKVIFANQNNQITLNYTLKKLNVTNLLLLNTAHFILYRPWQKILSDIDDLKQFCERIIVTIPVTRFDFNRLKYSHHDIANLMNGMYLDHTVIVCR
jgi:hypothetical protein